MKRLLFLTVVAGALISGGCKKSESVKVYVPGYITNAGEFVQKFGPQKQYFTISTTELPREIILDSGTHIVVPANAIQKHGDYVAGNMRIEAYEFLKRSDIVLGGINTNHYNGFPLDTRGILSLQVFHNGEQTDNELKNLMEVSIPSSQGGYIKISSGNPNAHEGQLAWGPQMIDSITADGSVYTFNTMSMGWLNAASYFSASSTKTTLKVKLSGNPGAVATCRGAQGNTFVYFCPESSKVALQVYKTAGEDVVMSADNQVPAGIEGRLCAYSVKENKFYYAEKEIVSGANSMEELTFVEVPVEQLLKKVRELDSY